MKEHDWVIRTTTVDAGGNTIRPRTVVEHCGEVVPLHRLLRCLGIFERESPDRDGDFKVILAPTEGFELFELDSEK